MARSPSIAVVAPDLPSRFPSAPPREGAIPISTAQILLVEDERIIAADIRRRLTQMGYTVLATASSGLDAIEKAQALGPTLVLMDIKLEGAMDGVEAGKYIQAHCHIPVVYMTAYLEEQSLRTHPTESFLYISKPVNEDTIRTVIEEALGGG